jgi:hypothetical protein
VIRPRFAPDLIWGHALFLSKPERFPHSHAQGVAIFVLGDIKPKIM